MDVVLIRWPPEAERRERLVEARVPRLLLVEEGQPPPPPTDCLEDWLAVPADETEMRARVAALEVRANRHRSGEPDLDDHDVLRFEGGWVSLPPVEARLTRALLDRYGAVVARDVLARAGWPDGAPGRNALDVHVLRLRRRMATVGLAIRTVRSRGYLLEPDASLAERGLRHA